MLRCVALRHILRDVASFTTTRLIFGTLLASAAILGDLALVIRKQAQ